MDHILETQISQAKSVLILLPNRPYFDQVAAGLALYLGIKPLKEVTIACPTEMYVEFNRLVGVDKITREMGNKNLVIGFPGYQATDIERVSYDIENGEFKLSVIPKPGIMPPGKDQLLIAYSGISADTVFLIGGASDAHFPDLKQKDLSAAKKIHIGTRELQISEGTEILSLARPASSTSELVATLIKESGYDYDTDIATNLYLGIETATNHFATENTTAETFQIVADLLRAGARRVPASVKTATFPPGAVPGEETQAPNVTEEDQAPKDWLGPKIFKGTSVS